MWPLPHVARCIGILCGCVEMENYATWVWPWLEESRKYSFACRAECKLEGVKWVPSEVSQSLPHKLWAQGLYLHLIDEQPECREMWWLAQSHLASKGQHSQTQSFRCQEFCSFYNTTTAPVSSCSLYCWVGNRGVQLMWLELPGDCWSSSMKPLCRKCWQREIIH